MTDKTYEIEQIGQVSVSAFADAIGAYDHISEGGDESHEDITQPGSDMEPVRDVPEDESGEEDSEDYETEDDEEESGDSEEEEDEEDLDDEEDEEDDEEGDDEEEGDELEEEELKIPEKKKLVATTKTGKKIVVPKDATVKHKVDGQEVSLSVQDLLNDYAGRETINRKINEAKTLTREAEYKMSIAEREVQAYEDTFKQVMTLMAEGKPDSAIDVLAALTKQDPVPLFEKLIEKSLQYAEAWSSMDESEKKAWKAEQRARYLEKEATQQQEEIRRSTEQRELDSYVNEALVRTGFSSAAFYEQVNLLAKEKKLVQPSPKERANFVIGKMLADKHIANIEAVSKSFGDRVTSKMKALVAQNTTPQESQDSIRRIFKGLLKQQTEKVAKTLSGKVRPKKPAKAMKKESRASQNEGETSFSNYLDLIESSY